MKAQKDGSLARRRLEAGSKISVSHKAFLFVFICSRCAVTLPVPSCISAVPGTIARARAGAVTSGFISGVASVQSNTRDGDKSSCWQTGVPPSWKVLQDGSWMAPRHALVHQSLPVANKSSGPCLLRGKVVHVPVAWDVYSKFLIKCSLKPPKQPPEQCEKFRCPSWVGEWRTSPGACHRANHIYFWPLCIQHQCSRCSRDLLKIKRYSRERVKRQLFP